ncbi:hypothetical protein [Enterobacter vonholyi]|uniref:hypothetical protein n=1 Tax=Enterobacter vonholyi TaxID=2797505 RepID=UPI0032B31A33
MEIWNFINNSWFVGIVGGILSGLVTTWIGRKLFSEKDKKEYIRKVDVTNKEIVYSLRSAISDNVHHDHKIITSLMSATARKNGVLLADIYSIKEVTEDLIKEVMDSSFIPSEYKKRYCETLARVYFSDEAKKSSQIHEQEIKSILLHYSAKKDSIIGTSTALLGVMVTLITFLLTIIQSKSDILERIDSIFLPDSNGIVFLLTAPVFVAILSMMLVFVKKWFLAKQEIANVSLKRQQVQEELKEKIKKEMNSRNNPDGENENSLPPEN